MGLFTKLSRSENTIPAGDGSDSSESSADEEEPRSPGELVYDHSTSVTGEPYHEEFLGDQRIGEEPMLSTVKNTDPDEEAETDVVAGPYARELIETHYTTDDEPLWLGYAVQNQGVADVGIEISQACKHLWVPGTTGAGKSTLFEILQMQLAYAGYGFVAFDPKGQDSRELLAKLPEHRLDDVIFVDPASADHDKTIALNILEIPKHIIEQGEMAVEKEIVSRKQILKAFFEGDQFWGANMEFITEVLGDATMRANVRTIREGGDPSTQYTIIDIFSLVFNATTRENFVEDVNDPLLAAAVQRVSDMDDSETLPTLKRIVPWILNRMTRRIISHRESSLDFREIVEEDKIVIVRTAVDNQDIKQMLTLGVMRMVWSAIQRRADLTDGDPKPYFLFADEFDDIASDQLDMDRMLTKARSMRLSVTIACQYPDQIGDEYPGVLRAIKNNANTLTAFKTLGDDDARVIMERFGDDYDKDDLIDTEPHKIWTKITYSGSKSSPPLKLNTIAPYPKLRSKDRIDEIIEARLEETGVDPLSTQDILRQLPYDDPYGMVREAIDGNAIKGATSAQSYKQESIHREIARAVFHEGIFRGQTLGVKGEDWWINADRDLKERADRYVYGGIDTEAKFDHFLDEMDGDQIELRQNDGRQVTVTDSGRAELFITGDSQTGGKADHRDLAEDSIIALVRLGLEADVVQQNGGRDVDGVVRIREIRETGVPKGVSPGALGRLERQRYAKMEAEHPFRTWLTDGSDCTVEFEKSTAGRKSLVNWAKAYNAGEVCLFTARPEDCSRIWNAIGDPVAVKSDEDGTVRFYNHTKKIAIGGEAVVIEDASTAQWSHDEEHEEYVLADEEGVVRARFDTHHEILSNKSKYDGTSGDYDDAELGDNGPHLTVNMPIIPVREFDIESRDELDVERDVRVLAVPENVAEDDRPIREIIKYVTADGELTLQEAYEQATGPASVDESPEPIDEPDDDDDEDDFSSLFVGDRGGDS